MTISSSAAAGSPRPIADIAGYRAGACNIGPAEIARRRRTGHAGLVTAVALLAVLVAIDAPAPARLLVALPAIGSAAGYLQARLRFCAAFGWRGVANFGPLGRAARVEDREAMARDRARALQIGLASLAIGVAAGVAAVLLPV